MGTVRAILTCSRFGIVYRAMSKLPDITDADALIRIIEAHPAELLFDDRFRNLVVQNVEKLPEQVRDAIYELMRQRSLDYAG